VTRLIWWRVSGCAANEENGRVDREIIATRSITVNRADSVRPDYNWVYYFILLLVSNLILDC
jgi:hypothetical protein